MRLAHNFLGGVWAVGLEQVICTTAHFLWLGDICRSVEIWDNYLRNFKNDNFLPIVRYLLVGMTCVKSVLQWEWSSTGLNFWMSLPTQVFLWFSKIFFFILASKILTSMEIRNLSDQSNGSKTNWATQYSAAFLNFTGHAKIYWIRNYVVKSTNSAEGPGKAQKA